MHTLVLPPALTWDESVRQRFIQESEAAAAVDDPHIIPVYDAGEVHGVLFIAMRYVDGTDLKAYLREFGLLSPGKAASIIGIINARIAPA